MKSSPKIFRQRNHIIIPGFATVHSHAFQRALRGRTQRRQTKAGSFWSWRGLMYELAGNLDPDNIFNISRFAFVELAMSGVTAVGEFHYVHHQQDGTPYDDRTILADSVIRAAKEVGVRITLIRTAYFRAGHNLEIESIQKRFCDPSVDKVLQDIETLLNRYESDPMVNVALAAHSIRAVPIEQVKELADYARKHSVPFHMHVAEQRREVEECKQEYGKRPVELLAENGILSESFIGIHATHLAPNEIIALADANAFVRASVRERSSSSTARISSKASLLAWLSAPTQILTPAFINSEVCGTPSPRSRSVVRHRQTNAFASPNALISFGARWVA